jgi:hypothetical protein
MDRLDEGPDVNAVKERAESKFPILVNYGIKP